MKANRQYRLRVPIHLRGLPLRMAWLTNPEGFRGDPRSSLRSYEEPGQRS